jgi:hypothetical protein
MKKLIALAVVAVIALTLYFSPAARAQSAAAGNYFANLYVATTIYANNIFANGTNKTIVIKGSPTPSGTAQSVVIDSSTALSGTDQVLTVKVNGVAKFGIWADGTLFPTSDNTLNLGWASNRYIGLFGRYLGDTGAIQRVAWVPSTFNTYLGNAANGSSAFAHKFGANTTLSTDGARIAGFYSDANSTLRFSVHASGGIQSTSATLATCNSGNEGRIDRDVAAGVSTGNRTRICVCTSDGAGTPAYAWRNLATGNVGTSTTCPD